MAFFPQKLMLSSTFLQKLAVVWANKTANFFARCFGEHMITIITLSLDYPSQCRYIHPNDFCATSPSNTCETFKNQCGQNHT
jgi:hypothetical protein